MHITSALSVCLTTKFIWKVEWIQIIDSQLPPLFKQQVTPIIFLSLAYIVAP